MMPFEKRECNQMFFIGGIVLTVVAIVMAMGASAKAEKLAVRVEALERAAAAAKAAELPPSPAP